MVTFLLLAVLTILEFLCLTGPDTTAQPSAGIVFRF
jgi:hypothetical protein